MDNKNKNTIIDNFVYFGRDEKNISENSGHRRFICYYYLSIYAMKTTLPHEAAGN